MEIEVRWGIFKNFDKKSVVAVEPCKNLARLTKKLFEMYDEFWNLKLANKLKKKGEII